MCFQVVIKRGVHKYNWTLCWQNHHVKRWRVSSSFWRMNFLGAIINLLIKHEIMPHIVDILDPTIMWKTIKTLFEQKNDGWHLVLKTKLTNLWLEEGASIVEYFKQLKDLTNNQLVNIGKQIWHKIYLILSSTSQGMFLWIFCRKVFLITIHFLQKNQNTLFYFHLICIFEA